ncbi:hypothetical protein [Buttiauxella sp.]|uniref:hypothetical protein n=1 Tax=Buttiauxella sp. TaxID=1972222 RepID=UPI003C72ADA9
MKYFDEWPQCKAWLTNILNNSGLCTEEEISDYVNKNKPLQFPCIAYVDANETFQFDDHIVYIYKDQIDEWSALMTAPSDDETFT